jgi:hypothetical protein
MSFTWRVPKWMKLLFLLIILASFLLLSGCMGPMEAIVVAPEVPEMADVRSVAIFRFSDYTGEGVGMALTDRVWEEMAGSYSCIDVYYAHGILANMGLTIEGLVIPENAIRFGKEAGVDAIIIGEATACYPNVYVSRPSIYRRHENGKHEWIVEQETSVNLSIRARVLETKRGRLIYSGSLSGRARDVTRFSLDYRGPGPVPMMYIPPADWRMIPYVKDKAVAEAATNLTSKLVPRKRWVPKK